MNGCCHHPGCRPSAYAVGAHPHHCTIRPRATCPAYQPGVGCVPTTAQEG